jgi:hypothetical protein
MAWLVVIAGCGASAPHATPKLRPHPCEAAHWSELAEGRLRVWPPNANAPAHVIEVAGDHVEVASVTSSVIVARWVAYASLGSAAMSDSNVSPTRGADGDPSVRILTGHRLDTPSYGWAAVHAPEGFVPAGFAGAMWTEEEPDQNEKRDRRFFAMRTGDVRTAPDDAAPLRIAMTKLTLVEFRSTADTEWLAITVYPPFTELDGFWKRPPPEPPDDSSEIDMGSPAIHSPIAAGTCLYDNPRGRVVGMIRAGDEFAPPVPSKTAGWYEATIPTVWGPSTYYIDTPPIAPPPTPPPASEDDFRWPASTANGGVIEW